MPASGQFLRELGRCQDDLDFLSELLFVGFAPLKKIQQPLGGIQSHAVLAEVLFVNRDQLVKGQRGDHRCIADGLQLHMPAGIRAFQLDNDQIGTLVEAQ